MGAAKIARYANIIWSTFPRPIKRGAQILKNINRMIYACDIAYQVKIPETFTLPHQGLGVIIAPGVIIGSNCTIYPNVTLGAKNNGKEYGVPIIGEYVMIGAGTCILGNVTVGSNVMIGANSVVLSDVPDNTVIAGNPAKIIKLREI